MNRKGAITRRNYQVLRDDASPRGVNSIYCNSGEAHTALRGWRPISAGLLSPFRRSMFRSRKTSLITTKSNCLNATAEVYEIRQVLSTSFPSKINAKKLSALAIDRFRLHIEAQSRISYSFLPP